MIKANKSFKLTLTLPTPQGDALAALMALTLQAKNLRNTALYLIRQVLSAYEFNEESGC